MILTKNFLFKKIIFLTILTSLSCHECIAARKRKKCEQSSFSFLKKENPVRTCPNFPRNQKLSIRKLSEVKKYYSHGLRYKSAKQMNVEELKEAIDVCLAITRTDRAIEFAEKLISTSSDKKEIQKYKSKKVPYWY